MMQVTTPILHRYGNRLLVIRYPFGPKANRTIKLGFKTTDAEGEAKLKIFINAWKVAKGDAIAALQLYEANIGGKAPEYERGKTRPDRIRTHHNAVVVFDPEAAKREKRRQYQRDWNSGKRGNKNARPPADASLAKGSETINDLIGILISQMQTTSTTLKLLQDALQKK